MFVNARACSQFDLFNTVLVGELTKYKGNTYGMSMANANKVRNVSSRLANVPRFHTHNKTCRYRRMAS